MTEYDRVFPQMYRKAMIFLRIIILMTTLLLLAGCSSKSNLIQDIANENIENRRSALSVTASPEAESTQAPSPNTTVKVSAQPTTIPQPTAAPQSTKIPSSQFTSPPAPTSVPTAKSSELKDTGNSTYVDASSISSGSSAGKTTIKGFEAVVYQGNTNEANYDVMLIGDSLTEGLYSYADLGGARVYARVSARTSQILDELQTYAENYIDSDLSKILVTLGTNDRGSDISASYKSLIDYLASNAPNADIYVSLIPYANSDKAESSGYEDVSESYFDRTNSSIRTLSGYRSNVFVFEELQKPWCTAITSDYSLSSDGLHFSVALYKSWAKKLYDSGILK